MRYRAASVMAEAKETKAPDFEKSLERLAKIVEALETGELPLDESLKLFEEGVKLSRAAQERLDKAEKRIELLLGVDPDGNPRTAPFEGDDEP